MTLKTHFSQAVESCFKPLKSDIRIYAYLLWEKAGKPDDKDLHFYYEAEHYLNHLANKHFREFTDLIYKIRPFPYIWEA